MRGRAPPRAPPDVLSGLIRRSVLRRAFGLAAALLLIAFPPPPAAAAAAARHRRPPAALFAGLAALANASLPDASLRDNCFLPHRRLDVVVAHFQEPAGAVKDGLRQLLAHPNVAPLHPCVTVYTKGPDVDSLRRELPFAVVVGLPNVGREGHTALHHITHHHFDLPGHMLMLQASLEMLDVVLRRLTAFTPATGFMCMAMWGKGTGNCAGGEIQGDPRLRELWVLAKRQLCFHHWSVCYRGQWLASAQRLRRNPGQLYRHLERWMALPSSHVIHNDRQGFAPNAGLGTVGSDNAPALGHALERAWTFFYDCHAPPGHEDEPAYDGTLRCECFDPPRPDFDAEKVEACTSSPLLRACQCLDSSSSGGGGGGSGGGGRLDGSTARR